MEWAVASFFKKSSFSGRVRAAICAPLGRLLPVFSAQSTSGLADSSVSDAVAANVFRMLSANHLEEIWVYLCGSHSGRQVGWVGFAGAVASDVLQCSVHHISHPVDCSLLFCRR